jgi:predicted DNA-binding ribbon-helix-helix protein
MFDSPVVSHTVLLPPRKRTTVRLEREFSEGLLEMAREREMTVAGVLREIARRYGPGGFTSRVRVAVLGYYRGLAATPVEREVS